MPCKAPRSRLDASRLDAWMHAVLTSRFPHLAVNYLDAIASHSLAVANGVSLTPKPISWQDSKQRIFHQHPSSVFLFRSMHFIKGPRKQFFHYICAQLGDQTETPQ